MGGVARIIHISSKDIKSDIKSIKSCQSTQLTRVAVTVYKQPCPGRDKI
jgi:hypothetical protein